MTPGARKINIPAFMHGSLIGEMCGPKFSRDCVDFSLCVMSIDKRTRNV